MPVLFNLSISGYVPSTIGARRPKRGYVFGQYIFGHSVCETVKPWLLSVELLVLGVGRSNSIWIVFEPAAKEPADPENSTNKYTVSTTCFYELSMAALNPSNPRAAFNIFQPFVPSRWRCKALARWTTSKVSNWERPVPEGPVYFDPPPEWNENDWGNAMPGVGRNGAPRGHHGSNLGHPWWGMATWSSIVSLLRLSCYGYLLDEHQHIMNV